MFYFDPKDIDCKFPAGAIKAGGGLGVTVYAERSFCAEQAFLLLRKDGEDEVAYPMEWSGMKRGTDAYSAGVGIQTQGLYFYGFLIGNGAEEIKKGGFVQLVTAAGYAPSKRLNGGVMYQIFPDRFNIGGERLKTRADARYRDDWGGTPSAAPGPDGKVLNNEFFGGNLEGVIEKLPWLKALGVTCVYLNPVFKAFSNHKYDTGDYTRIDPDFGDNETFERLCRAARAAGIDIILDGVFSHTGADSIYFNKFGNYESEGAYNSQKSPYYNWYRFKSFPDDYGCWWDFDTLPNVNEEEPSYNDFINGENGVVARWLTAGAAGWRLDVADELPDGFLDSLCQRAKAVKKDAVIIGEVWEDAAVKEAYGRRRRYFQGGQLDGVTNYPLRAGIISFVKGEGEEKLLGAFETMVSHYPKGAADTLMNVLGTHDTERILTVLNGGRGLLKAAAALLYSMPGVPCVYYGDEAGMTGGKDPFCRGCYPWGGEDKEILSFYKALGGIRKKCAVFKTGAAEVLYASRGVFIMRRFQEKRGAKPVPEVITAVNIGKDDFEFVLEGSYKCLLSGGGYRGESIVKAGETVILLPSGRS